MTGKKNPNFQGEKSSGIDSGLLGESPDFANKKHHKGEPKSFTKALQQL
jgi:hypothetical protein